MQVEALKIEEGTPKVELIDGFLECVTGCEGEHSYAISTENGKIILKGRFEHGFRIDVSELSKGYYQLTIFDALKRDTFAFHIK
tara:strand:+ start:6364 stop:6615 length:252 start_codon:yes stop_codon:yes gene_type:complete